MGGLLLVAASGLAREVLAVLRAQAAAPPAWVLDDDPQLWGTTVAGAPVIGGLQEAKEYDDSQLVVCAGRGAVRRRLVSRLRDLGVGEDRYARVVHPSVHVPDGCSVGEGSILLAQVVLTAGVSVGRHVVAMPHVTLTHDDAVEDYATLCAGVSLGGNVRVGEAAYLGMNAGVRENVTVGAGAVLGMGAALLRDQPADQTWVGVPAAPLNTTTTGASQ
jgi:sugar O-acyltransferase (sialic acid O-acetyltransferase NeuD family)